MPVSLPFQFPQLLNFSPPGAAGAAGRSSAPSANSGFPLAQSDLLGERRTDRDRMRWLPWLLLLLAPRYVMKNTSEIITNLVTLH